MSISSCSLCSTEQYGRLLHAKHQQSLTTSLEGVTTTALSCNRLSGHFVSPVTDALLDSQPDLTPKYFQFWQQVAFHAGMVSAAMEALTSLAWRQDLWMMIPQGLRCTGQTSLTGPCRLIRRTWRWVGAALRCRAACWWMFQADTHGHTLLARCSKWALLHHG